MRQPRRIVSPLGGWRGDARLPGWPDLARGKARPATTGRARPDTPVVGAGTPPPREVAG
jgi:hypothetical protein